MEIRPVAADDLEQELDLRVRAFGPLGGYRERVIADDLADMAAGRMLGAYEGSHLLGPARYLDMRQWWGGLVMPMAGVAGVKTSPEARGRGLASALLTEMLAFLPGGPRLPRWRERVRSPAVDGCGAARELGGVRANRRRRRPREACVRNVIAKTLPHVRRQLFAIMKCCPIYPIYDEGFSPRSLRGGRSGRPLG